MKRFYPILIIIAFWFVFASPYFLKSLAPFPSRFLVTFFPPWSAYYGMPSKNNAMPDIITQIYPWRHLSVESLKLGGWGLWNPYSFSGTVHAANYQSAVFQPLNLLFFFLTFIDAWSLLVLFQPLLAGIFTYAFLRSLERSIWSSLFGSIAFMFCGFITTWMEYGTLGYAVLYLPLILFGIHEYSKRVKKEKNWWYGCIISIGICLSFLSGHFQMSMYVWGIAFCYALFLFRFSKKNFFSISIFLCLGILLALPQLAVTYEAFLSSNRISNFISSAGIPWKYFVTLLAPDFYGNPVTRNDWFGQYAEWSSYIGVLPLFFAGLSLFYWKKWEEQERFFFVLGIISLFLATISPVSQLLYLLKIPVISTSVTTRMIVFFSFSLILLGSWTTDWVFEKNMDKRKMVQYSLVVSSFLFCLWFILLILKPFTAEQIAIAKRNLILPTLFVALGVAGLGIGNTVRRLRTIVFLFLIGITFFDLLRFTKKWIPFEEKQFVFPSTPAISFLKEQTRGGDRVFGNIGNEMNTYFGIPSIEGYDAMYQERYGEFISAAADGKIHPLERSVVKIDRQGIYTQKWFELLGVKYIVFRKSDGKNVWVFPHWKYPSYRSVFQDEQYEVLENTYALPRAFLASSYIVKQNKEEILGVLASNSLDVRSTVILEQKPSYEPQVGAGAATITSLQPHRIEINIDTSVPKLLFLSDVSNNGWKAYINEKEIPIQRANYAFRAVFILKGKNRVIFVYRPSSFMIGVIGAVTASFVLFAGSMRQLLYDRRHL